VLAFVFMEAFHLNIKKGVRVHGRPRALLNQCCKILFVLPLDPAPLLLETQITCKTLDTLVPAGSSSTLHRFCR